jgi:uncharacterized surface protein with fasciclin (FAS1) repeats
LKLLAQTIILLFEIFICARPFTVLAPTNEDFLKNPALLGYLSNPHNRDDLQEVILYYLVPGLYFSDNLEEGPLETLLGEDVDVRLDPLMFNKPTALEGDVLSCNGVIHGIGNVLIPPGKGKRCSLLLCDTVL